MTTPRIKLYPSTPLENRKEDDLEQKKDETLKGLNSFNDPNNSTKEMITYFKDKKSKSKRKWTKYKMLTTVLKSFDTFVLFGTTSSSITLSLTSIGLIVIPISTGLACGLSISNKVVYEIFMRKNDNHKQQYHNDQQTIKFSVKIYRRSSKENLIDEIEYKSLCNFFRNYDDKNKN